MICQAEGCDKKLTSNNKSGYCRNHRHHSLRKNNPEKICEKEGCDKVLGANNKSGYCSSHYYYSVRKSNSEKFCVVEGCNKVLGVNNKSGYCSPDHRELDPKRKEQRKRIGRDRYLRDREAIKQASSQWAKDNRDKRMATSKKWFNANKERYTEYSQKRRAIKSDQFIEDIDLFSVWCRDSGLCFLCGFPADKDDWWLEHIIPLSRGGQHSYENVVVSHETCNRRKNDKLMGEWEQYLKQNDETNI